MRRVLPLVLILLLPVLPAAGGEEAGTTCDLFALVDADDAGTLVTYDGLRKGLELAYLPRVCRHDPAPETGGIRGFLERQAMIAAPRREAGATVDPLFAVGEASCAAVGAAGSRLPFVFALTRYSVRRAPLVPLLRPAHGALVYADVAVERVATLVQSMLARSDMSALERTLHPAAVLYSDATLDDDATLGAFAEGFGGSLFPRAESARGVVGQGGNESPVGAAWAVLCLHLDPRRPGPDFEAALAESRLEKRPLVSDDRAHFGLGAVVVLVPRHDLLGKAAAEAGRSLRLGNPPPEAPRAVPGFEVWVDLAAADAIGFELPLAFLARADRLKRGRPGGATGAAR